LEYYRRRYYKPDLGIFASADPLGPFAGPHGENTSMMPQPLYNYVGGNPVVLSDPTGMFTIADHYWMTWENALARGVSLQVAEEMAMHNAAVDADQASDFKHGMLKTTSGWGLVGAGVFFGMCREDAGAFESVEEAIQAANKWIVDNLTESADRMCKGDALGAAQAAGRALHTIQDREAHRDRYKSGHTPATMYQHCRQSMDNAEANPWFWTSYYDASWKTFSMIGHIQAEARFKGVRGF
jgi:RHS repeat-associated protein